jgi:hypothetical protein
MPAPFHPQTASFNDKPIVVIIIVEIQPLTGGPPRCCDPPNSESISCPLEVIPPKLLTGIKQRNSLLGLRINPHGEIVTIAIAALTR